MQTPITYYGGKQRLSKQIVLMMEKVNYKIYTEPFCGGASILFAKPMHGKEAINDLNLIIYNFFDMCNKYPNELSELVEQWPVLHKQLRDKALDIYWSYKLSGIPRMSSESKCNDINRVLPKTKKDRLKLAWATFYLTHSSFNVTFIGGFLYKKFPASMYNKVKMFRETILKRLSRVVVTNNDWKDFMSRYDTKDTIHFIDPPYVSAQHATSYVQGWDENDFDRLIEVLDNIKGYYILTCQYSDKLNKLKANIKHTNVVNLASSWNRKGDKLDNIDEVIAWNYDLMSGDKKQA